MQDVIKKLISIGHKRQYNEGEIVFYEGQNANQLFILLQGEVRLYKASVQLNTKECTLHIIKGVNFIAEMPFFMEISYPASAECITKSEIIHIDMSAFKRHCLSDSVFLLSFIGSLCQKIHILESHIANANKSLKVRFIDLLLTRENELDSLTQRKLAQILNIAPESLSRILKALKKQQLISTQKGKIIIKDKKALKDLL